MGEGASGDAGPPMGGAERMALRMPLQILPRIAAGTVGKEPLTLVVCGILTATVISPCTRVKLGAF